MEYLKFFELQREPFQNDPDGRFYFESGIHRRARLLLLRGVQQRKALSVLIGGPGCGKTTLARHIFSGLEGSEFAARLLSISHPDCARGWLLPTVAREFGVAQPAERAPDQLAQIHKALIGHIAKKRHPVLLVDEAQLLANAEVMEEFRGLMNLVHEGRKTLSLVLFGLPELSDILRLDAPLAQRVEIRAEVSGLGLDDVKAYVQHRLECAGGDVTVFSDDAVDALCTYTGGVPRLINTLADNTLFEGMLSESRPVDASLVAAAADQLELRPVSGKRAPRLAPRSLVTPHTVPEPGRVPAPPAAPAEPPASELASAEPVVEPPPARPEAPVEDDPIAELDLALEDAVDPSAPPPEDASYSDFSMGSLVRDESEDEELPVEEEDDELVIPLVDESGSEELDLDLAVSMDDDDELMLDAATDVSGKPFANAAALASAQDHRGASQELPSSKQPAPSTELGASLELDKGGDSEELEIEFETEAEAEADESEADPEPTTVGGSPAFDPGELLTELDEVEEVLDAVEFEPEPETPAASDEPSEDLDDLFESIQSD